MKSFSFITLILCLGLASVTALGQNKDRIVQEIQNYQDKMDQEFADPEQSILKPEDLAEFKGLKWYPINLAYRVSARLERTPEAVPFLMPTTTDRKPRICAIWIALFYPRRTRAKAPCLPQHFRL